MTNEENKMEYCNNSPRRRWRFLFIIPLVALAILGVSWVVMMLWNGIIPGLFPTLGIGTLTFCHAIGLLLLCKILFGGFRKGGHYGGGWRHKRRMHAAWKEKWMNMSEEDKAKFKEQWKNRCGDKC